MSRGRNTEPQLYKVYIKAEREPKIPKKEAEQKSEFCYISALTGSLAMVKFDNYAKSTGQRYFAWFYRTVKGGEQIDRNKIIETC
jgi:hypothetical protein